MTIHEHLSYDMIATWVRIRDHQRVSDDPERQTWKDFDRMREAMSMVITPWRCKSYEEEISI